MLEVQNLHAYYGKSHILQGVSFNIQEGEIDIWSGQQKFSFRNGLCDTFDIDIETAFFEHIFQDLHIILRIFYYGNIESHAHSFSVIVTLVP